jgi:hypothetical protein
LGRAVKGGRENGIACDLLYEPIPLSFGTASIPGRQLKPGKEAHPIDIFTRSPKIFVCMA